MLNKLLSENLTLDNFFLVKKINSPLASQNLREIEISNIVSITVKFFAVIIPFLNHLLYAILFNLDSQNSSAETKENITTKNSGATIKIGYGSDQNNFNLNTDPIFIGSKSTHLNKLKNQIYMNRSTQTLLIEGRAKNWETDTNVRESLFNETILDSLFKKFKPITSFVKLNLRKSSLLTENGYKLVSPNLFLPQPKPKASQDLNLNLDFAKWVNEKLEYPQLDYFLGIGKFNSLNKDKKLKPNNFIYKFLMNNLNRISLNKNIGMKNGLLFNYNKIVSYNFNSSSLWTPY